MAPGEALNLEEALNGFTNGPAWGSFLEGQAGVIQEGVRRLDRARRALDRVDTEEIRTVKVRETWVAGKKVYAREKPAQEIGELK